MLTRNNLFLIAGMMLGVLTAFQLMSSPPVDTSLQAEEPAQPVPRPKVEEIQTEEIQTTEQEALRTFMVVKLKNSQQILAGLTAKDFKKIEKGGQELITMSLASSWQVYETPGYKKDSLTFRNHAGELVKAARKKDLKKCTDHYFQVVRSCVECHENVRKARVTRLPQPHPSFHGLGE